MTTVNRFLARGLVLLTVFAFAPAPAQAGDKSYSAIIKHLKSNYRAKGINTFGMMMLARFAVKVIRPAGVKNFKVSILRELNFAERPDPNTPEFHNFIRGIVDPHWRPLIRYNSRDRRQWNHVYIMEQGGEVKFLVLHIQEREAFVAQFKFDPDRLVSFIDNPTIMGISLKGDDNGPPPSPGPAQDKSVSVPAGDPPTEKTSSSKPPPF